MENINLNLLKNINISDSKVNLKNNKKEITEDNKSFQNYLTQSKNEIKDNSIESDDLRSEIKEESNNSLETALNKIDSIIKKQDDSLENNEELSNDVSEVILLLLNYFSKANNEVSKELKDININNIKLEDISKVISDEISRKHNNIDKENIVSILDNIKGILDEKLNATSISNTNSILSLMEEVSVDDKLINELNLLVKNLFNKDNVNSNIDLKYQLGDNQNLEIVKFTKYLEENFNQKDLNSNVEIDQKLIIDNLNTLEKVNKVEISKESLDSDFLNNKNYNDDFNMEDKKNLSIYKEEDFLKKILNEDSSNKLSNNYYDKATQHNFQNNIEVINEPIVINKESINVDIVKNIKYMISDSIEEVSVKIYPKELGELTIKILSEEGIMKAEIKATSKETYNLLNSNIHDIKKTLENQNIKIQEVNIGIYNEDTTFFSGKENKNQNSRNFNENIKESYIYEDDDVIEEVVFNNNVNYLA